MFQIVSIMPSNKSVPDDDPELQDILMGGVLKEATLKDCKRMLGQFKEFVLKETAGINLEELAWNKEGLERLDNLFSKYFLTMEVTVTEEGQEMKT